MAIFIIFSHYIHCINHLCDKEMCACILSKIEKVPRGIQGEKSRRDMASSRNLVSTIGAQASPKKGDRTRCPERYAFPGNMPYPLQMLHGNHSLLGEGQARYQGNKIGGTSDRLRDHCSPRVRMSLNIRERET